MSEKQKNSQLLEEMKLLIQYSVPASDFEFAVRFVERYRGKRLILIVLAEYYSTLPEGREEAVTRIATLDSCDGALLLVVSTEKHAYLYAVSEDAVVWLGEYGADVEPEILRHFGYQSQKNFHQKCPLLEDLVECEENGQASEHTCPACGVFEGESHLLGCSVEVCPWCDGQLSKCNCRFEQLEVEEITSEEQLETFIDVLVAKGRIPYTKGQKPAYPGTSTGLDEAGDG